MGSKTIKKDRTARLLRIQLLLQQHPQGLEMKNIARICSVHIRTIYRDLQALETELEVPIWQEGKKRGIVEGYFLPPITFTLTEAMSIFACARLLYHHSATCNTDMLTTFMQLSSITPPPLRRHIQDTIDHIDKLPRNENRTRNFNKLLNAWLYRHTVKIFYQEPSDHEPSQFTIDPYFIEPNIMKNYNFLVGYCHSTQMIRAFRINYIVGNVIVDNLTSFETPSNFDVDDYSATEWDSYANEKTEPIKLRFSPRISKSILESKWSRSQKINMQANNSIIMTLKAKNTEAFRNWVLSFGRNVEVLEPEEIRQQILECIKLMEDIYTTKQQKDVEQSNNQLLSKSKSNLKSPEDRRVLSTEKIQIIRNDVLNKGLSVRSVAMHLGISRNTVAKYIRVPQSPKQNKKLRPKPVLDKVIPRLGELLKPGEGKYTEKQSSGSKIHRKLVEEGYKVSIATVRNYLRLNKIN